MLLSLVLELKPLDEAGVPLTTGNAVHAWFINAIAEKNWVMSSELHRSDKEKPFTTSSIFGTFTADGHIRFPKKNEAYWLRFTSLSQELTDLLLDLSRKWVGRELNILGQTFEITRVFNQRKQHPWADQCSYEQLYNNWVNSVNELPRKSLMVFYTPTTFRAGRKNIPLPFPKLFFSHLSAKWNQFSPVNLGSDIAQVLEERVGLSACNIATKMFRFRNHFEVGFTGSCEFITPDPAPDIWDKVMHLLCDFAFYSGVGAKTTMGMGQVRRLNGQSSRPSQLHPEN
jgi:CRISPR-associated endoribonuclease Cas6